jgi:hypothetical protein
MTPEQHADTVREGLKHRQRGTGSTNNTKPYLAALDALVALAERADTLERERDDADYAAKLEREATARLRARTDTLERERDEAQEALQSLAADHYFARAETAETAEAVLRELYEAARSYLRHPTLAGRFDALNGALSRAAALAVQQTKEQKPIVTSSPAPASEAFVSGIRALERERDEANRISTEYKGICEEWRIRANEARAEADRLATRVAALEAIPAAGQVAVAEARWNELRATAQEAYRLRERVAALETLLLVVKHHPDTPDHLRRHAALAGPQTGAKCGHDYVRLGDKDYRCDKCGGRSQDGVRPLWEQTKEQT